MNKDYKILFLFLLSALLPSSFLFSQCNLSLNVAYGKTAVTSSVENAGTPASNAFDGNITTRWSSAFSDPQYIYVDLGSVLPLCQVVLYWENAYGKNFTIDISNDAVTWTNAATITGNTVLTNTITISGSGRYVRMNGTARATVYGYSLYEFQVYSTNPSPICPSTNIALNQPAATSSIQNASFPASNAFDGNSATRWSSASSDPQYIYVDLGAVYSLCKVSITWENAYGKNFTIDVSNNATTWTTLYSITGNAVLNNSIPLSGSGRYVRMYGTARGTTFGYSIWEFTVNGSLVLPVILTDFTAVNESGNDVMLRWKTQQEVNNKLFEVQRSSDGRAFTSIGRVAGKINSSIVTSYSFKDLFPPDGTDYYRLKQIDLDGKFAYSEIIQVTLKSANLSQIRVYPNPVKDWVTIQSPSGEIISAIQIYTLSGVLVSTYDAIFQKQLSVSLLSLSPGVYIIKVHTGNSQQAFRIIRE